MGSPTAHVAIAALDFNNLRADLWDEEKACCTKNPRGRLSR